MKASPDSWVTKAPIPTARQDFGVAVVNGEIYAIGDIHRDPETYARNYISTNEEYDPAHNSWTANAFNRLMSER